MKVLYFIKPFVIHLLLFLVSMRAVAAPSYDIDYLLDFSKNTGEVLVTIRLASPEYLKTIDFNLKGSQCQHFEGEVTHNEISQRLLWTPSKKDSKVSYRCTIAHKRKTRSGDIAYDAWSDASFAIFRGDDLIPPAKVVSQKRAESRARVAFKLPKSWPHVNTGWRKAEPDRTLSGFNATFEVENPNRKFDRPTGWMIVGDLGTRREILGNKQQTQVAVSAPKSTSYSRMDALVLVTVLWPQFELAFVDLPPKILVVSGDDPLWRGGLSAGNSLFLHAQRPLVSENATSTLLHELVHVVTRLRAKNKNDWIVEGIAEYYASALLFRAGAITAERYQKVLNDQQKRSGKTGDFRKNPSKFVVKAAAANFFYELNMSIRKHTASKSSLDAVVQRLMKKRKITTEDLQQAVAEVSPESLSLFERFQN